VAADTVQLITDQIGNSPLYRYTTDT